MSDWRDWIGTAQYGKCEELLPKLPDKCAHAIVTDPPYGLKFMGETWDKGVPGIPFWREALRVAMPGAYLLAFGGTRMFHRLMCAIEDAGWEIRDTIMWVYGSGFPKSHDVSKAIDKAAGVEREAIRSSPNWRPAKTHGGAGFDKLGKGEATINITAPATEAAKYWQGWGTALKPAWEPIIVARKPLEGTVAENVLKYGTGAMDIDGSRIEAEDQDILDAAVKRMTGNEPHALFVGSKKIIPVSKQGRWPANLIHDGSEEVVRGFPSPHGAGKERGGGLSKDGKSIFCGNWEGNGMRFGDSGSAARFFYCAKASKAERGKDNKHPTVKPLKLMKYLVTLVSREDQLVLDMFAGSGTTLLACKELRRKFIGFECELKDVRVCNRRLSQEVLL